MAMLEEISLTDDAPPPVSFSTGSENLSDQQQTIITNMIEQGRNAFSQWPSYNRLLEDESESDDQARHQTSFDGNVLSCKKQHCRCLCYIVLAILLIILIFLFGFRLGQTFHRQSMVRSSIQSKYTLMWTNDSSNFDVSNSSISKYYYTMFEIRVVVASNYTFFTESNITTYGYIYNNTFSLDNSSLSSLRENDNCSGNGQFNITVFLQPWTSYILVVKTFSPKATDQFLIIASGSTNVALRQISIPPLHQTVYSSELTTHSQVYCRDRCSTPDFDYDFDDDYYYETILINASKASDFTLMTRSSINTYGYLYENSFDPSDTSLNLIIEDDNSGNNEQFKLTSFLQPSTIYVLVVTTFSPHVMGKFSIIASGMSFITLTRLSFDRATTETTANPSIVHSNYNGRLNTNSPLYCRGDCSSSGYYYETIMINVDKAGSYSFRSQSDFGVASAIYTNSFDPSYPSTNLLGYGDDDGGDRQFNFTVVLQPQSTYVLVVITYSPLVTGSFQIIASGPMLVNFIRATNPSTTLRTTITREIKTLPNIPPNATWTQDGVSTVYSWGNASNQLCGPRGFYVDDDQTILIADTYNHRIVEWKFGAASGQVVAGGNGQGRRTDQFNEPIDVLVDKQTNSLIICDRENQRVMRWSRRSGTTSGETIVEDIDCYGLTMDGQGFLYVSVFGVGNDDVRRYGIGETNGTLVAGSNEGGDRLNQLDFPNDVFVDRDQSIYVAEFSNERVTKWIKGAKEGIVVAGGQGKGNDSTQLSGPSGVFVDLLGTVYVADSLNSRVMRWCNGATQGDVIAGGNGWGSQANQMGYLADLSFDRHGNLYVLEEGTQRIKRFSIKATN